MLVSPHEAGALRGRDFDSPLNPGSFLSGDVLQQESTLGSPQDIKAAFHEPGPEFVPSSEEPPMRPRVEVWEKNERGSGG